MIFMSFLSAVMLPDIAGILSLYIVKWNGVSGVALILF